MYTQRFVGPFNIFSTGSTRSFGIQLFIEDYYAPILLKPFVRICVVFIFVAWLASSLYVLPYIDVGLDQVRTTIYVFGPKPGNWIFF